MTDVDLAVTWQRLQESCRATQGEGCVGDRVISFLVEPLHARQTYSALGDPIDQLLASIDLTGEVGQLDPVQLQAMVGASIDTFLGVVLGAKQGSAAADRLYALLDELDVGQDIDEALSSGLTSSLLREATWHFTLSVRRGQD